MRPIDLFLEKFPDARESGSGWSACCPAHEDRSPSLSIGEGDDGRVLLMCHAGCQTSDVLRAMGMSVKDLMPPKEERHGPRQLPPRAAPKKRSRRADGGRTFASPQDAIKCWEKRLGPSSQVWTYHSSQGDPVGVVARFDLGDGRKEFRPASRTYAGWCPTGMPEPRPLYRLPDLAAADVVYVVEGEKAADAARSLGLTATTSSFGAKSPEKTDWTPLADKDVVILPDNDEQGHSYADKVRQILQGLDRPARVKIVTLPNLPPKGDIADVVQAATPEQRPQVRDDLEALARDAAVVCGQRGRKRILVVESERPRVTDDTLDVLANHFYSRGGELVRIIETDTGPIIVPLTAEAIDDAANRHIQFTKQVPKRGERGDDEQDEADKYKEVDVTAPAWLSKNIFKLQHWPSVRTLTTIHAGPFIREDGSLGGLRAGYDARSQCYVATREDWSELATPPTESDVRTAVETLSSLVKEFPFDHEASFSAWLACILTRLSRSAFHGPSPLFIFEATAPGSGKTLLAKLVGLIADGHEPGMANLSSSDEELRKSLTSLLQAGETVVVLDNVTVGLNSPSLDRFLTASVWQDRLLGSNRVATLPNTAVVIATANNAEFRSDTARRSLAIRLKPAVENPENRVFEIPDLVRHVQAHRREFLIAAIRILQWHVLKGRPTYSTSSYVNGDGNAVTASIRPFGSFEGWSAFVRHAVIGAGLPDPLLTANQIKIADEPTAAFRTFLEAWQAWNSDWQGTTRQMIDAIFHDVAAAGEGLGEMRDAITQVVGEPRGKEKTPTAADLGIAMRKYHGRVLAGLRVESLGRVESGMKWRLVRVDGTSGG